MGFNMVDCDFSFPHSWEVHDVPEFPGAGEPTLPMHYFPPPTTRPEHNGLWIKVQPESGREWIGVFAYGYDSPSVISKVFSTPDPHRICVIARGKAYSVDARDPGDWFLLPVFPVVDARSLPEFGFLLLTDFSRLIAWGEDGMAWREEFPVDGLKITSVGLGVIELRGYAPAEGDDVSFKVELRTGRGLRS